MEISRKTDYALRMLSALVEVEGTDNVVSVREVAEENDIPYSFARSIQHDLAQAGIVESLRGARGGMKLSVDPKKVSLRELVEAVQGPIIISGCDFNGENGGICPFLPQCHFNPVWCNAERMLRDYFSSVSLYDVVVKHKMPTISGDFALIDNGRGSLA